MPITTDSGGTTITGDAITLYRLLALRGRLQLEVKGLKFRQSTYAAVKREFGFKGGKAKVLSQLSAYIESVGAELAQGNVHHSGPEGV